MPAGPSSDALGADRVYVGFWTDKGSCDESIAAFLTALDSQEVFLFGTAGFGGSGAYFEQILTKVRALIPDTATVVGTFMCQGRWAPGCAGAMRRCANKGFRPKRSMLSLANFDTALTHPDDGDILALRDVLESTK
ncbi:MAG: flavodoxin family protein [Collinsella sp.]